MGSAIYMNWPLEITAPAHLIYRYFTHGWESTTTGTDLSTFTFSLAIIKVLFRQLKSRHLNFMRYHASCLSHIRPNSMMHDSNRSWLRLSIFISMSAAFHKRPRSWFRVKTHNQNKDGSTTRKTIAEPSHCIVLKWLTLFLYHAIIINEARIRYWYFMGFFH